MRSVMHHLMMHHTDHEQCEDALEHPQAAHGLAMYRLSSYGESLSTPLNQGMHPHTPLMGCGEHGQHRIDP